jgi:hypothetical protein
MWIEIEVEEQLVMTNAMLAEVSLRAQPATSWRLP